MLAYRLRFAVFRRTALALLVTPALFALGACAGAVPEPTPDDAAAPEPVEVTNVIIASTTSTEDSGLFAALVPAFEDAYPQYRVSVVAVGTGQALEIGRSKDADVVLVHSKADEEAFVAEGYGEERLDVMYNDFVLVGPPADPAGVAGGADAVAAFTQIADGARAFISRGDDSGTHKKEMNIWDATGITAPGPWYLSVGQGMGEVLTMASEVEAYTLADRGTYLAMRERLELDVLVEGDERLFNPYGVIVVTGAANLEGARAFASWIVSAEGQEIIRTFGVDMYGEPLFVPDAR